MGVHYLCTCTCMYPYYLCFPFFSRRKAIARKARETRRSTQPVPTDLLQRIKQSDEVEEKELEDSLGGTIKQQTTLHNEEKKLTDTDTTHEQTKSPTEHTNAVEVKSPILVPNIEEDTNTDKTTTAKVLQSAYKPASRPASKILSDDDSQPSVVISEILSNTPPTTTNVEQSQPPSAGKL